MAGAGTTSLAIFEPRTSATVSAKESSAIGEALVASVWKQMNDWDVWGIELLVHDAVTSAALERLGTRSPEWNGKYTNEWVTLLNTNELISFGAMGEWQTSGNSPPIHKATYEVWDFVLNHKIGTVSAEGADRDEVVHDIAAGIIRELQLYFAEVVEIAGKEVVLNVGSEALSTGSLLAVYAHGHLGHHPPFYPPHGHREEDDHFYGSKVYVRYRGTEATSASVHAHSRSRWRILQMLQPASYAQLTTLTVGGSPYVHTTDTLFQVDQATSMTLQEKQLINASHFYSGRQTGVIRITGFVRPSASFQQQYAIGVVTQGFAVPGGFVRRLADPKSPPRGNSVLDQ